MEQQSENISTSYYWWEAKRLKYNVGLVIAGLTAFITYVVLASFLIAPYDHDFEITLFTTLFQGIGYLIMMVIANLFFNLGHFADKHYNTTNSDTYRKRLFNFGFWFSVGLPFLILILVVISYLVRFS